MKFGQALVWLLSAALFVGCERKPIEVTPSGTNLSIPATAPTFVPPPLPTQPQPKLETIKIFLGAEELNAEMALTAEQQRIGMMHRTNHTDSDAMLFVFPYPYRASFWMKNCPESLSAAYISPEGVIEEIHHLEKQDTNSVVAGTENIQFVLEVKDGWFQRHNVKTGDLIRTQVGPLPKAFFEKR